MIETFFTEKRIINKIIIALVFIFMFNFTFSYLGNNVVFAVEGDGSAETTGTSDIQLSDGGGKLLLPIHALVLWIADAVLELMQNSFYSSELIIQKAKSEDLSSFNTGALVLCIVAVVICSVAVVYTAGAAASIPSAISTATAQATAAGTSTIAAGLSAAGTIAGQIGRRYYSNRCISSYCI